MKDWLEEIDFVMLAIIVGALMIMQAQRCDKQVKECSSKSYCDVKTND